MKIDKKSYPQVYLERCKYNIKKIELVDFIDVKLDVNADNSDDSE